MIERTVTAHLLITRMRQELRMTEEQLLIHLALEHVNELSHQGQIAVFRMLDAYHRQGIFTLRVDRSKT